MDDTGVKTQIMAKNAVVSNMMVSLDTGIRRQKLEARLAKHVGAEHCVLTSSGTAGMLIALRACGVTDGDSVMCTSFNFFATTEIIALAGGVPALVDTNPNTFNIDPYCLEYALKKCARTDQPIPKVLISADLFGLPCDFDKIEEICGRYGVTLIEDMSCAFGASYKGRKAGSFGRFSVASFFPARPLGDIGDGGGIFCRNRDDMRQLEFLRGSEENQPYDFVQASIVGEKLSRHSGDLSRRHLIAARYRDNFKGYVRVQQVDEDYISAYTQFVIELDGERQREYVIDALRESQIPCGMLHCTQRARASENDWERVVLVNTQKTARRILAIPMNPHLSVRVVDYISECIMRAVEEYKPEGEAGEDKENGCES